LRRLAAIALLIAALTPLLWVRESVRERTGPVRLHFTQVESKTAESLDLGPFRLDRAWTIEDRGGKFGSYSGLVALGGGRLLAVTDGGLSLEFSAPDAIAPGRSIGGTVVYPRADKYHQDAEAATRDPQTGRVWIAFEFSNIVARFEHRGGKLLKSRAVHPPAMSTWGNNSGPESLARLPDGRFLTIREGFVSLFDRRRHAAVLFANDPVADPVKAMPFTFVGPSGYSPTDATALPDGRVLVLMRRVVWPMPPIFGGAIAIGDPRTIRENREWPVRVLATWRGRLPVDNFEGLAIEPPAPGDEGKPLTVWVISDDNRATLQRSVLWKLRLDPADLPTRKQKGARNLRAPPVSARPDPTGK
jgi:hypothetical protein